MEKKQEYLIYLANIAYKVGYGTQKHFTTYDITMKMPLIVSLFTITIGCISLINHSISNKYINISLIILGVVSMYISNSEYYLNNNLYISTAKKLNEKLFELTRIFNEIKTSDSIDREDFYSRISSIENKFHEISLPNQIVFSGIIAKYLFKRKGSTKWIKEIIPDRFSKFTK